MHDLNHELKIKNESIKKFELNEKQENSATHGGQFKPVSSEVLNFHNLYRKNTHINCKSCDRQFARCKCCERPARSTKKLNLNTKSRCAGCLQEIQNGTKNCTDSDSKSDNCRSLEAVRLGGSSSRVSDAILSFHHLTRGNNGTFSCVSCLSKIKTCKCCVRPSISAPNLNFEAKTKCAGCLSYIRNGKKVCLGQNQNIVCRKLENTIKKRKFDVSFSNRPEVSAHVRVRRNQTKSENLIVSVSEEINASKGLQIIADWTISEKDKLTNTNFDQPEFSFPKSKSNTPESILNSDLSIKQLSDMNSELLRKLITNHKKVGKVNSDRLINQVKHIF